MKRTFLLTLALMVFSMSAFATDVERFLNPGVVFSDTAIDSCSGDCNKLTPDTDKRTTFSISGGAYLNTPVADLGVELTAAEDPRITLNLRKRLGQISFAVKAGKIQQLFNVQGPFQHEEVDASGNSYSAALEWKFTKSLAALAEYTTATVTQKVPSREAVSTTCGGNPCTIYLPLTSEFEVTRTYSFVGVRFIFD